MDLPVNEIICGAMPRATKIFPDSYFDAIITDPPYELGFMGKSWDNSGVAYNINVWREALRIAKPGAIMLCFGGTRTYHRLTCAIEDAGWQIRDCMMWLFGQGFPKSLNFGCKCRGKAVPYNDDEKTKHNMRPLRNTDISSGKYAKEESGQVLLNGLPEQGSQELRPKGAKPQIGGQEQSSLDGRQLCRTPEGLSNGAESKASQSKSKRVCSGTHLGSRDKVGTTAKTGRGDTSPKRQQAGQSTEQSSGIPQPQKALGKGTFGDSSRCPTCGGLIDFAGYGTALKPAWEPIIVAMKPLDGTFAHNAEKHGVAGLNIDGGRIGFQNQKDFEGTKYGTDGKPPTKKNWGVAGVKMVQGTYNREGRWPANVILDPESARLLDEQSGESKSTDRIRHNNQSKFSGKGIYGKFQDKDTYGFADSGGASRFFYCAKASRSERNAGLEGMAEKENKTYGEFQGTDEHAPKLNVKKQNNHPTVKPLKLMEYLCKLLKPPSEHPILLDPFCGSGTTLMAAINTGWDYVGVDKEKDYCEIARLRTVWVKEQKQGQKELFPEKPR